MALNGNGELIGQKTSNGKVVYGMDKDKDAHRATIIDPLPPGSNYIGDVALKSGSLNNNLGKVVLSTTGGNALSTYGYGGIDSISNTDMAMLVANNNLAFNGANWDRWRNNTEGVLLVSASRAITTLTPTLVNYNATGILISLDITANTGTGTIRPILRTRDSATGNMKDYAIASAGVSAVGTYQYLIYPSASISGGKVVQTFSVPLPRTSDIYLSHSDSSQITYSVSYALIL